GIPLVSPRKHERAAAARRERRTDLPAERLGLLVFTVSEAVEPQFAHQQRPIARHVLQAAQVRVEPLLRFQIDVERDDVEKREIEVLGRRIVDVRDQAVRVRRLDNAVEVLEISLDLLSSQPTDHRRRDLVAKGITKKRWMRATYIDFGFDPRGDLRDI